MTLHRASGVFFVVFAAAMYFAVIPDQTEVVYPDGSILPDVLPLFYTAMIGFWGSVVALQQDGETDFEPVLMLKVAGFFVLALIGVFAMRELGFLYVSPVLAGAILWLIGERRPLWFGIGAVVGPVGIWAFFEILLGRLLP